MNRIKATEAISKIEVFYIQSVRSVYSKLLTEVKRELPVSMMESQSELLKEVKQVIYYTSFEILRFRKFYNLFESKH